MCNKPWCTCEDVGFREEELDECRAKLARAEAELSSERETLSALADCYVDMKAHAKMLHEALADFAARSTTTAPTTLVREAQRILAKTPKHWVAEQGEVFARAGSLHGKTAPSLRGGSPDAV